jgi:hypothetical protein
VEGRDLFQLRVDEFGIEGLGILVGPGVVLVARVVLSQQLLELGVVNVRLAPRLVHSGAQGGAELHLAIFSVNCDEYDLGQSC